MQCARALKDIIDQHHIRKQTPVVAYIPLETLGYTKHASRPVTTYGEFAITRGRYETSAISPKLPFFNAACTLSLMGPIARIQLIDSVATSG